MSAIQTVLDALLYDAEWFASPVNTVPTTSTPNDADEICVSYGCDWDSDDYEAHSWFLLLVREALLEIEYQQEELLLDAQWWFDASIEQYNPMPVNSWANYLQIEWGWKYVDDRETEMWFDLLIREAINPL